MLESDIKRVSFAIKEPVREAERVGRRKRAGVIHVAEGWDWKRDEPNVPREI